MCFKSLQKKNEQNLGILTNKILSQVRVDIIKSCNKIQNLSLKLRPRSTSQNNLNLLNSKNADDGRGHTKSQGRKDHS